MHFMKINTLPLIRHGGLLMITPIASYINGQTRRTVFMAPTYISGIVIEDAGEDRDCSGLGRLCCGSRIDVVVATGTGRTGDLICQGANTTLLPW